MPLEGDVSSLEAYLPHRPPLVLLGGVERIAEDTCDAWLKVDPQAWYARPDGSMPGWFGIELMAQTIAAYSGGTGAREGQAPKIGYLLGTQSYRCEVDSFPAHTLLRIHVRCCFRDDSGLHAFECTLDADGTRLAESTLKVFQKP